MKFEVRNRWSDLVQFTAEIDCDDDVVYQFKLGAAVKWAIDTGANLRGADLRAAKLSHADLSFAELSGADLCDADLRGANLSYANLSGANLGGANLIGADLHAADLIGAGLSGADLGCADLGGADLRAANLSEADLSDANLRGANLICANLNSAQNVGDFTMPDGMMFSAYLRDVVPALLTAGGKSIADVVGAGAWQCHSWENCPMRVALNISSQEEAPPLLRARVQEFVKFFDAGLIPKPKVEG